MAYRIKAQIGLLDNNNTFYYFMGYRKNTKLPMWNSEVSTLPHREWTTKSALMRTYNDLQKHVTKRINLIVEETTPTPKFNVGDNVLCTDYWGTHGGKITSIGMQGDNIIYQVVWNDNIHTSTYKQNKVKKM